MLFTTGLFPWGNSLRASFPIYREVGLQWLVFSPTLTSFWRFVFLYPVIMPGNGSSFAAAALRMGTVGSCHKVRIGLALID